MTEHKKISDFIAETRERFNLVNLLSGVCWGVLIMSAGMLCVACVYVFAGYAVNRRWFWLPAVCGAVFALGWYLLRRLDTISSAARADKFFGLHDSLLSAESFYRHDRRNGIYELQARCTVGLIEKADASKIRFRLPRRLLGTAFILAVLAAGLCFLDNSPAVAARIEEQKQVDERTAKINEYLKKQYEELEKKLTPEQKEQLKKSELKKRIGEFQKNKDLKEMMSKLAGIEKEFRKLSAQAAAKQDEKFLKKLGREMANSKMTKKLGAELSAGEFSKAAKTLKDFKSSEQKKKGKDSKAIRDAMKRLARQMSGENENSDSAEGNQSSRQGDVEKAASKFRESTQKMKSGEQGEEGENGESGEFKEADSDLDDMAGEMELLDMKLDFSDKMGEMAEMMGMCQNFAMNGPGKEGGMKGMPGIGESKGKEPGKGIGTASAGNRRDGGDKINPAGKTTELKGVKGSGPSAVSVSDASSGSGVTGSAANAEKKKAFKRQVENFVRREDIPENLKGGVKEYFEIVHKKEN